MSDPMRLRPSARLQRYLGRELIADPNLAVLEFVKNAYDAGASEVSIEFVLLSSPTRLLIADNGTGMDQSAFRANWLRPGFSSKSSDYHGPDIRSRVNNMAAERADARSPAGEKGLGRLAAGRLGDVLTVYTRPSVSTQWLKVVFDWATFDDMNKLLEEIDIPFEMVDESPVKNHGAGTIIEITNLSLNWAGRLPGRPAPGRSRTRLGRLKQDLAFLIRGETARRDFSLLLTSDDFVDARDVGIVDNESASLDSASYVYEFDAREDADHRSVTISRVLHRAGEVAEKTGRPLREELPEFSLALESITVSNGVQLSSGPFSGRFVYTPPPAARRARDVDAAASGVLLYRDEILVEPYGLGGDDWLGVEARKASRQGHAAIQPSTFSGEVRISRSANPGLVDMSNRLGLIDNQSSTDFLYLVRNEFSYFESLIYEEVLLEDRWLGKKENRASAQAAFAQRLANVRLRAIAHRAGQPLQALGFDVSTLGDLSRRPELDADVATELSVLASAFEANVRRLGTIISELTDVMELDFKLVDVAQLIERAVAEAGRIASRLNVSIEVEADVDLTVLVPEALAFEALTEVLINAVEAPRPEGRPAKVVVSSSLSSASTVRIVVSDNGGGIAGGFANMPLSSIESTKGRPAEGVVAAETAAVAAKGSLALTQTGPEGTVMTILLPRRVGA